MQIFSKSVLLFYFCRRKVSCATQFARREKKEWPVIGHIGVPGKLKDQGKMKQALHIIIYAVVAGLTMGCTGKSSRTAEKSKQPQDTIYTAQKAMAVYDYQPERALQIIDSAVIVGNLSEVRADVERARIYSMTQMKARMDSLLGGPKGTSLDSGRVIGERVLGHDSLKQDLNLRQQLLEVLVYTARMQQDTLKWMQRSRELIDVCRREGVETEALRTEAELGAARCYAGQAEQGMATLDSVIAVLGTMPTFKFNELDAFIIASKRKIGVLSSTGRYVETLPLARRIIERLEDYEVHPDQFADDSKRVPADSASRASYINFYRTQAQGYISAAYTALGQHSSMTEAYLQIERSVTAATAREHIARYNAMEQRMQRQEAEARAEREQARADRNLLIAFGTGILLLLVLIAQLVYWRQKRIINRKNRVLVKQMKQIDSLTTVQESATEDDALYNHLRDVILAEQLYLNPQFGRQAIIEKFQLSKERIGAVFSQGGDHSSLTDFVNNCRLDHARQLLTNPSGFGTRQTFSRNFVRRFGLTPTEYRSQLSVTAE